MLTAAYSKSAADSGKGAESIPYSSLRSDVEGQRSPIDDYCKDEKWSCDNLATKSIRENINRIKSKLEVNKAEQRNLEEKLAQLKTEIEKMASAQQELEQLLKTDLEQIDKQIETGMRCMQARLAVQTAFKSAIEKANGENDPDIKAIATQLIDYWTKRQQDHQQSLEKTKVGIEKCQKCKSGDL